jgi:hypothetical protein
MVLFLFLLIVPAGWTIVLEIGILKMALRLLDPGSVARGSLENIGVIRLSKQQDSGHGNI